MTEKFPDKAGVIAPPPLIFLGTLLIAILLHWLYPINPLPMGIGFVVGVVLIVLSLVMAGSALSLMRRAGTSLNPEEPTTAIVTSGPFRYTRNPIYVSMTLIYLGITLLANALWPLVLLPFVLVAVDRGVIAREERYLERKFGEEYIRYKARVRRWL